MIKMCKSHPELRCYHSCCDIFDCSSGAVNCCFHHSNPFGRFISRAVKRDMSGFSFVCRSEHWRGALR